MWWGDPPPNPSFFSLTKQINETVLGKALYKGVILNKFSVGNWNYLSPLFNLSIRLLVYFSLSQNVYLRILFLSKFYSKGLTNLSTLRTNMIPSIGWFFNKVPPDLRMNFFFSHIQIKGSIAWFNTQREVSETNAWEFYITLRLQCLIPSASIHLKQRKRWNQSENKRFNLTIKPVASFELFNTFC